ncbi:MAG: phospholipase D-like domain-containing protein [Brachymonas sp.]|nr:phospholipase D-like domain-containing protein [Brachymonas sp.]
MHWWPTFLSALGHGIFVVSGLLVYVLVTRAGQQRRHPAAAIGWVLGIVAFPYLGVPLFLTFGGRKFTRPNAAPVAASGVPADSEAPEWASALLVALGVAPPSHNAQIRFLPDGTASLDALLNLLRSAERQIDICTFILGADRVGQAVVDALIAAAQRGVRCRLLVDAIGSLHTVPVHIKQLRAVGVTVKRFMPLLHNPLQGRTNLRNHRKLAVADGARLWAGGQNLADEYFIGQDGMPAWIDLGFEVEGPLATAALAQFERDWNRASRKFRPTTPAVPAAHPAGPLAQWIPTGPDGADDTIHALLLAAAYHAKESIVAVTPYFVPDEALMDAWCIACRRGVQFTLVLPHKSNHRMADIARERALRRLVQSGARVWLLPDMLHAKAVIVDQSMALSGSLNLDGRSLFLNYEAMVAFYGRDEVGWLQQWAMQLASRGKLHAGKPPGLLRDVLEGVVRLVAFQL